MTQRVNFEIAKLLKEKGFNERTYSFFFDDVPNSFFTKKEKLYYNRIYKSISAPTIADVVMWLYDKCGIWVTVCVIGIDGFGYWLHDKNRKRLNPEDQGGYWHSPTEAYLSAIEYTLNNLI